MADINGAAPYLVDLRALAGRFEVEKARMQSLADEARRLQEQGAAYDPGSGKDAAGAVQHGADAIARAEEAVQGWYAAADAEHGRAVAELGGSTSAAAGTYVGTT